MNAVKQTELTQGMYVKIPKGTKVHKCLNYWPHNDDPSDTSARDVVVQVSLVYHMQEWEPTGKQVMRHGRMHDEKVLVDKGWAVAWSDNKKWTAPENVTIVDAPAPRKKPAERTDTGPTLRQQMTLNSTWKMTDEVQAYNVIKKPVTYPGGQFMEPCLFKGSLLAAGTEFKVTGKTSTGHPLVWRLSRETLAQVPDTIDPSGVWVPIEITSGEHTGKTSYFRVPDLKDKVELQGEQEVVPIFVLRDSKTGLYYENYEYIYHRDQSTKTNDEIIQYTDKWSKYRKWNRLSDVRQALLGFSGYYDGLPGAGDLPEWMGGPKCFDVPQTWEIVKFDKLTKKEIEVIEAMDTFNRAWKLRELTVNYGGNVRAVYNELEKKGKLDEFSAMLSFQKDNEQDYWNWEVTDSEKAEINECLSMFDKKDIKVHKSTRGFAIATKDIDTAVHVKLAYSGDLKCALIDFKTMSAVVK